MQQAHKAHAVGKQWANTGHAMALQWPHGGHVTAKQWAHRGQIAMYKSIQIKTQNEWTENVPSPLTSLIQQQVLRLQVTVGDANAVQIDLEMAEKGQHPTGTTTGVTSTASTLTTPAINCWKNRCASGSGIPISGSV